MLLLIINWIESIPHKRVSLVNLWLIIEVVFMTVTITIISVLYMLVGRDSHSFFGLIMMFSQIVAIDTIPFVYILILRAMMFSKMILHFSLQRIKQFVTFLYLVHWIPIITTLSNWITSFKFTCIFIDHYLFKLKSSNWYMKILKL